MSIFRSNKKKVDKGFKKMDKIVTGLVLWSIVASVYGIKKNENHKNDVTKKDTFSVFHKKKPSWTMSVKDIIKWLIFWVEENKKPGFFKSVFSFIIHITSKSWKK